MPKITVLMTVYNGEKYLKEAINSILNQTYRDYEFLIVNDGSTDSTREIIKSYQDSRIYLVDNEQNIRTPKSLNRGLKMAKGELIARQDADDVSLPERLEKQISFLERNQEIALLGSWYIEIDENGKQLREYKLPCENIQISWDSIFYCPFSTVVFRKELILNNVGYFDESIKYGEDWEFYSKIARTYKVANIGEYLIKYRIHSQSVTSSYGSIIHDENSRIRTTNYGNYIELDPLNKIEVHNKTVNNMHSMLFMDGKNLLSEEIGPTAAKIIQLHSAFSQKYRLDKTQSETNLANIYLKIANVYSNRHNISKTAKFIARACKLKWNLLFSRIIISILLKCSVLKIKYYIHLVWVKLPISIRMRIRKTFTFK